VRLGAKFGHPRWEPAARRLTLPLQTNKMFYAQADIKDSKVAEFGKYEVTTFLLSV